MAGKRASGFQTSSMAKPGRIAAQRSLCLGQARWQVTRKKTERQTEGSARPNLKLENALKTDDWKFSM